MHLSRLKPYVTVDLCYVIGQRTIFKAAAARRFWPATLILFGESFGFYIWGVVFANRRHSKTWRKRCKKKLCYVNVFGREGRSWNACIMPHHRHQSALRSNCQQSRTALEMVTDDVLASFNLRRDPFAQFLCRKLLAWCWLLLDYTPYNNKEDYFRFPRTIPTFYRTNFITITIIIIVVSQSLLLRTKAHCDHSFRRTHKHVDFTANTYKLVGLLFPPLNCAYFILKSHHPTKICF